MKTEGHGSWLRLESNCSFWLVPAPKELKKRMELLSSFICLITTKQKEVKSNVQIKNQKKKTLFEIIVSDR